MRPNSTIHMSTGCQFVDACPCAPRHYRQRPRSPSQICTRLPILLKTAEKLTANPVLSKRSPFAQPPVQPQRPSRDGRSHVHTGRQGGPPGAAMPWPGTTPAQSQVPQTLQTPALPSGDFCQPGTVQCCPPSLAPTRREEFYFILCVPLCKICIVDEMLLFLPL